MANKIINKLENELNYRFKSENSGHDLFHLKRVYNLSNLIQRQEGGDELVVGVAAYLHDIHRLIQNKVGKYCSPKDSLPDVKLILDKVGFPEDRKGNVLHCVEFHEEYGFSEKGKTIMDIETLILQDADNLDAMGAIGVARGFMFAGAYNLPLWTPEIPFNRENFDESKNSASEIHHFYDKLLKLKDNMNTETGKEMAEVRHNFMENFLDQFFKEWKGEI